MYSFPTNTGVETTFTPLRAFLVRDVRLDLVGLGVESELTALGANVCAGSDSSGGARM